ncbi:MAG: hypothetical protein CR997_09465 [Acidobacteria bacterium]|nr:MAG: hypothetical protein CR997_09465 [Acidobacteriota bacterium]
MTQDAYITRKAKLYIQNNKIPFHDFFRNCIFGFVETEKNRGFFVHLQLGQNKEPFFFECKCRDAHKGILCEHVLALHFTARNWPHKQEWRHVSFENGALLKMFKAAPHKVLKQEFTSESNPKLDISAIQSHSRYASYLFNHESPQAQRDNKAFLRATFLERSEDERVMIHSGVPSKKCFFEQSMLYRVAKMAFFLEQKDALTIDLDWGQDHHIDFRLLCEGRPFFSWTMGVDVFLKGTQTNLPFWSKYLDISHVPTAIPTVYSIAFSPQGDLMIRPGFGQHSFMGLEEVEQIGHYFYCREFGYFQTQIGLSEFELTYSSVPETIIPRKKIPAFLKKHQNVIQNLERTFIDKSLFGSILLTEVNRLDITLNDYQNRAFQAEITITIKDQRIHFADLKQLLSDQLNTRYWNIKNRFFDAKTPDGQYLKALLVNVENSFMPVQTLFQSIFHFQSRLFVQTNTLTDASYQRMKSMQMENYPDLEPASLNLRPYQSSGYRWLWFLRCYGLGGLLCDQMGLGKTHQGMALLTAIKQEKGSLRALVVAPRSVLFHWQEKLQAFCPNLSVSLFYGQGRSIQVSFKSDIVLTSYGTLRSDAEAIQMKHFDILLMDEIQNAKNAKTATFASLRGLHADCRVGLTGTPIENRVSELKSLFDLTIPGYLGDSATFRELYEVPITKFKSREALNQLKQLVAPFILRRSKDEVLLDLPEKIEDLKPFSLTSIEREWYTTLKKEGKKGIFGEERISALHVFQLINKLKRLCCHPALHFGSDDYAKYPCQKWDLFISILKEALDNKVKVVIFTQYLGMIDLFKKYLEHHQIGYACITGSTRNRQQEQNRFQTDPSCRVFIGTIGAAGVGIDLTAATLLIHYDRWWNPAREEQATDRIHRIGQKQSVQIVKFMALDTIEERIDTLINRKKSLLKDVVGFDPEDAVKHLTTEELLEILT